MFDLDTSADGTVLDDTLDTAIWSVPPRPFREAAEVPGHLDPLSLRVVHLARSEAWLFAPVRGIGQRLRHWLVGGDEKPRGLADPRLEMLRAFCTLTVLGDDRSEDLAQTMVSKGHYSHQQLDTARSLSMA